MTGIVGGGGGSAFTYVQAGAPNGAEEGESWYDTDADQAYVYDGAAWIETTVTDHGQLSGVTSSDHHTRPSAGSGLAENAGSFDVSGVTAAMLSFDPATQTELNSHAGDAAAHHSPPSATSGPTPNETWTNLGSLSPGPASGSNLTTNGVYEAVYIDVNTNEGGFLWYVQLNGAMRPMGSNVHVCGHGPLQDPTYRVHNQGSAGDFVNITFYGKEAHGHSL